MDFIKLIMLLLCLTFSVSVNAGGIRWTDRYPFHRPDNVKVGEYLGKYDNVTGEAPKALLKGTISATVDDVLLTFTAFKNVPKAGLASLGLSLVKGLGPAMLVGTLAPLIWDEVLKIWKKDNSPNIPSGSNINNGDAATSACHNTAIDIYVYYTNGSACVKRCYLEPLTSPWQWANNAVWEGPNRTLCTQRNQGNAGYFPVIWYRTSGYTNTPQYVPATDADILAALNTYFNTLSNFMDFINKLIDKDLGQNVYNLSDFERLLGPSTLTSTKNKTTTTSEGQTTSVTTTTYNITYVSNSVNINQTTTTTTTYPDNHTETVTNTYTPTTTPGGTTTPTEPTPTSDFCALHPEILACAVQGTMDDPSLPNVDKPFSLTSELTSAGTCPADIQLTMMGHPFVVKWTLICQFASMLRPFVLIIAWLTAGIFVFLTISRV